MCTWAQVKSEEHRHWVPLEIELVMIVSHPTWVLGLQKQRMLLFTELSLQPCSDAVDHRMGSS